MNHSHVLYDGDYPFKVDPTSRNITNASSSKIRLMQYDHNSERFTFEIPRQVEGHDLALCNSVEVHYLNIEANTKVVHPGVYTVDDLQPKPGDEENTVVCSWLVPSNATQFVGQLQFLIRFACVNEDTGDIEYVWNTGIYTGISISSGIYNADAPSDNPVPPFNFVRTTNGGILKFFVGTQAEYDAIPTPDKINLFAIITDDTSKETLLKTLDEIKIWQTAIGEWQNGIDEWKDGIDEWKDGLSEPKTIETVNIGDTSEPKYALENIELTEGKTYIFSYKTTGYLVTPTITFTLYYTGGENSTYSTTSSYISAGVYYDFVLSYNATQKRLTPYCRYTSQGETSAWAHDSYPATIHYREI